LQDVCSATKSFASWNCLQSPTAWGEEWWNTIMGSLGIAWSASPIRNVTGESMDCMRTGRVRLILEFLAHLWPHLGLPGARIGQTLPLRGINNC
jgi:hypothetical protein